MDRRQEKTRALLFDAFKGLLAEKNYGAITIRDIIERANVGRTTFYDHFETKEALLRAFCDHFFEPVALDCPEGEETHRSFLACKDLRARTTHALYHLREIGLHAAPLLEGESGELLLSLFRRYLREVFLPYLLKDLPGKKLPLPDEFLQNHLSGSFVAMVQWWVRGGMKESPEELADYFLAVTEPIFEG